MGKTPNAAKADIGLMGLATMGRNLALNMDDHGFTVVVWNRTTAKTERLMAEEPGRRFIPARDLEELVAALERPRRIILMVKAGEAVDALIEELLPLLDPGDILMDGGNSWFKDTQARCDALAEAGLLYMGVGISGGEDGARYGPSIMPGGSLEGWQQVRHIFEAIAAKTDTGPCVAYIGPDGAGHFVKMVHNGIEYADMQLIAETYDILRKLAELDAPEISRIFSQWDRGPLESFLIELTARVLLVRDEITDRPLVDVILDKAGQKGTGIWTIQTALDLGAPVPSIAAAVDERIMSSKKDQRRRASHILRGPAARPSAGETPDLAAAAQGALFASKICAYSQGLSLISAGSARYGWGIEMKEIARIWKAGCIIRARLLEPIMHAWDRDPDLEHLLLDPQISEWLDVDQAAWRRVTALAQQSGVPVPAMSSALAYYDSFRADRLPHNLIQALRDAFGAHTYERLDQPEQGFIHTTW